MLLVDYRDGSNELLEPLQKMGLPAESGDIPADLAWEGRGEGGVDVQIGVEFKKLPELVASLRTERLQGHQLGKMRDNFDYSYLLIEGELIYDSAGRLCRRSGRRTTAPIAGGMAIGELLKRLHVLHLCGGLIPIWSTHRSHTLRHIEALYRVWTDCALDEHKSHIAIYNPPPPEPISEFRHIIKGIEGIGFKTTEAIEAHFGGSLRRAATAGKKEWMQIDGIGPKLASHIMSVMEGR